MESFEKTIKEIDANKIADFLLIALYKIGMILLVLVVAKLSVVLLTKLIKSLTKSKKAKGRNLKKIASFQAMTISIIKYSVYIIAILTIFTNILGLLDIKSVLATVGVGGVALGFGAQSLIKDMISGFFILLENQMDIGDYVIIGNICGTVKELDLRCVKIETYGGEIVFLPYGEIKEIKNMTKTNSSIIIDIPVRYDQSLNKVKESFAELCDNFVHNDLIIKLKVLDPEDLQPNSYVVRIYGKVKPCTHWDVSREVRKQILLMCEEKNIKLGHEIGINVDKSK